MNTQMELPANLADTKSLLRWGEYQVTKEADVELAGQAIAEIEGRIKAIKTKQDEFFGPLKRAIRDFEGKVKTVTGPLNTVSKTLRRRVGEYWASQQKRIEAEAKAAQEAKVADEKARLEQATQLAVATGDEAAMTEVAQRQNNLDRLAKSPPKVSQTVRSSTFTLAQTKAWIWRVTDENQIPREYFILDEKKLNTIAKGYGKVPVTVPGVEFVEEYRTNLKV